MDDLTVLLPTRNEAPSIGKVIDEILEVLPTCRILVVDSYSIDDTREIAASKGAFIVEVLGLGKGKAVRRALEHINTPYVIMLDSDFTYPAACLPPVYRELRESDVVLGYRYWKERGSMSLLNSFGNWALSLLASILYRKRVYDLCTGMWGFRTEALKKFKLTSRGFTLEADFFVNVIKSRCKVCQIPIGYRPRFGGSKAKLKIWDGFKIAAFLIRKRFVWK